MQEVSINRNEGRAGGALWRNVFPWQHEIMRALQSSVPIAFVSPGMQEWEKMMDEMLNPQAFSRLWGRDPRTPSMDLIENDKNFVIKAELPGLKPEDIDISVAERTITIAGEKYEEEEKGDEAYLCRECISGSFSRTVLLPERADLDSAEASFDNNVLTINVAKKNGGDDHVRKLNIGENNTTTSKEIRSRDRRRKPSRGKASRP